MTRLHNHNELMIGGQRNDVYLAGILQHVIFGMDHAVGQFYLVDTRSKPRPLYNILAIWCFLLSDFHILLNI